MKELRKFFGKHELCAEKQGDRMTVAFLSDSESDDDELPEDTSPK